MEMGVNGLQYRGKWLVYLLHAFTVYSVVGPQWLSRLLSNSQNDDDSACRITTLAKLTAEILSIVFRMIHQDIERLLIFRKQHVDVVKWHDEVEQGSSAIWCQWTRLYFQCKVNTATSVKWAGCVDV